MEPGNDVAREDAFILTPNAMSLAHVMYEKHAHT